MADGENDNDEEGEVPMLHLASFALHKLFSEWQSEGFEIPDFKIGTISPNEAITVDKVPNVPGLAPKRTTLPENADTMHPTTLLCMVSRLDAAISTIIHLDLILYKKFASTFLL